MCSSLWSHQRSAAGQGDPAAPSLLLELFGQMGEESSGSPDRKRGGRSSGRESWNLGFSGCFPGAFSAPITCWCYSPSSTLPRRKQMEKGVSLPNHAVGFQGHSHRSENPSLLSRGNRRVIKWCVQSHSL